MMNKFCIDEEQSIVECLKVIEKNKQKFAIILRKKIFISVITDGDIRRFIIRSSHFNPLSSIKLIAQKPSTFLHKKDVNIFNLSSIFIDNKIYVIPIVNDQMELINFITKEEFCDFIIHNKKISSLFGEKKNFKQSSILPICKPWGFYRVLVLTKYMQSKILTLLPMQSISLQKHTRREEHWIVAYGNGNVILENSLISVYSGKYIFIPKGCKHRIHNTSKNKNLIFIELQLGDYFGEDDIIRYEDKYNRV